MRTASISRSAMTAAVVLLAAAGCDSGVRTLDATRTQASAKRSHDRNLAQADVLRVKTDEARGRIWVLRADGVDLYDSRDAKLRSFVLPEWIWTGAFDSCPPDLALGPGGEVIVSSNVVPVLWRIDPVTFQVTRHEPMTEERHGRDVGFSGIKYLPRYGAYSAVNGLDGSLWRIDASLTRARIVSLFAPAGKACEAQSLSLQTLF